MNRKPAAVYLLAALLAVQSLGGTAGGLTLAVAPSGHLMGMPASLLEGSPFGSFLIPGLILAVLLGIFPGILAYALIRKPAWTVAGKLNIYPGIHWAWTGTLCLGIMLTVWIFIEILWIPRDILQTVFGLVGVCITVLSLVPSVMRYGGWKLAAE